MQPVHLTIKQATMADAPVLISFSKKTFFEFFAPLNDPANMEAYSATAFTPQKIFAELAHPGSEFYFASFDNEIIGYLKLNFDDAQNEFKDESGMEVERIYISGEHHGKYFGAELLQFAADTAKARSLKFIWLGVWETNHKAIAFYRRNSFEVFDKHYFMLGNDRQVDLLMKKIL